MKHPEHDVSVSISTKEFTCPEFNVKVRNSAVHCIIPGYPTKRWFVTLKLAPICESEEKCTHYLVILPNNESQVVARPKWWPAFVTFFDHGPPVGEDSYLHLDSTPRFFCPPPGADTILPIHWMIQLRIFRATMVYYPRPAAERPLSGARTIMAWRFEYRCPASIRDCPAWNDIPMWFEEGNDEWGRDSSANQAPHHESEKQQVVDISYQMDEEVDPPPAYYRGPRPKNPPRSDLRIRDLYHNLEKNHIAWRKVRSPLAGPADKRCSTDLRGRATRPMVYYMARSPYTNTKVIRKQQPGEGTTQTSHSASISGSRYPNLLDGGSGSHERVAPSPYEEASTPLYRLIRRHNITVETLNFFLRGEKDISRADMFGKERWLDIPGLPPSPVCEYLTDPELFYTHSMLEFHEMNERDRFRTLPRVLTTEEAEELEKYRKAVRCSLENPVSCLLILSWKDGDAKSKGKGHSL
ncbi:uncharacterized protein H6S33_000067 [Morchella sextelata]|uniref:uncharacterized protein n=1 Tax=Morchella sextelata TaxID=1174677 RepID=UPI001D0411D5|nr:uncharacterized protein H6S33_000067 [Morchella sextelata]KAH0614431.1 hypothetical protein H6S33_000067 [Morchella sextelata]